MDTAVHCIQYVLEIEKTKKGFAIYQLDMLVSVYIEN